MSRLLLSALVGLALAGPSPAAGQSILDLLASIRKGGGWVSFDIQRGRGNLVTVPMPTAGIEVRGCFRIWPGHTGSWEIDVRDTQGDSRLFRMARPDQPVPFAYRSGPISQLDVTIRWSEPRDTTLMIWVGLAGAARLERDPCEPVYGSVTAETSEPAQAAFRRREMFAYAEPQRDTERCPESLVSPWRC